MKYLNQFVTVLVIYFIGIIINKIFIPFIPATVIGMLLLLLLLISKLINVGSIKEFSDFMLTNLAFFFIPSGVSLIKTWGLLKNNFFEIFFIAIVTTAFTMIVTGLSVDFLIKGRGENDKSIK